MIGLQSKIEFRRPIGLLGGVGKIVTLARFTDLHEGKAHLFFKCRFTVRPWNLVKDWLGLHAIDRAAWAMKYSLALMVQDVGQHHSQ